MNVPSFLLALITAVLWGQAPILEKIGLKGNIGPLTGVIIRSFSVSVAAFCTLLFLKRVPLLFQANLRDVIFIVAGGILASFLGMWTYYTALKQGPASMVVPVAAIYPLIALILSVIFLHETLSWARVAGIALVVLGVILVR